MLLQGAAALSFANFVEEIPCFAGGSVRNHLVHIIGVEQFWIYALQDIPWKPWAREDYASVDQLAAAKNRVAEETIAYVNALTGDQLNTDLTVRPQEWPGPLRSPAYILHHIVTHSFHHKGQVASMLRYLGENPPDTDL